MQVVKISSKEPISTKEVDKAISAFLSERPQSFHREHVLGLDILRNSIQLLKKSKSPKAPNVITETPEQNNSDSTTPSKKRKRESEEQSETSEPKKKKSKKPRERKQKDKSGKHKKTKHKSK